MIYFTSRSKSAYCPQSINQGSPSSETLKFKDFLWTFNDLDNFQGLSRSLKCFF